MTTFSLKLKNFIYFCQDLWYNFKTYSTKKEFLKMSQKKEMCNYTVLSHQDVVEIYKNAYDNYLKEVIRFYEANKCSCNICLDETLLLKEMKKTFLFLNKYNIEPQDYLIKIMQAQSIDEIHEVQQHLNEYYHSIKSEISPLIAVGRAKRDLYGIQFPEIFKEDRIYLKTNPILSETELMEDLVEFLNYPLLRQEKFSFNCEVVVRNQKTPLFLVIGTELKNRTTSST